MPLNFTLQPDSVTGRRTFLIATAVSAISLLFPWHSGEQGQYILFQDTAVNNYTVSGMQSGEWITLLLIAAVPMAYLIKQQSIPSKARKLSLCIIAIVLLVMIYGGLSGLTNLFINGASQTDPSALMNGDTINITRQSGVGRYLFVTAQIACCVGISRFPKHQSPIINAGN